MADLTLLYYTANIIPNTASEKIRNNLLKVTNNEYSIISVSQKPINFGRNICVGEIGASKYNCYKQILMGVSEVKTKYVACVEDDTLYALEHFTHRPPKGVFLYERNYWFAQEHKDFYWRVGNIKKRGGMWGCVSESETLLNNLSERYKLFPKDPWKNGNKSVKYLPWGEPGVKDYRYGIKSKTMFVLSKSPCVIFVHEKSMGYKQLLGFRRRYGNPEEKDIKYSLRKYGSMKDLWKEYWENG